MSNQSPPIAVNAITLSEGLLQFTERVSEKDNERNIARETLKALLALGYRIEPPPSASTAKTDDGASVDVESPTPLPLRLETAVDLGRLSGIWRERNREMWSKIPTVYHDLADGMLSLGAPMLANEVVAEGLEYWPTDLRLRQLQGLALVRSGAIERAHRIFAELDQAGYSDEQTLGLLARTHKDLGLLCVDRAERHRHLLLGYQAYSKAYRQYGSTWTGINAAALALLLGEEDLALTLARAVRSRCLEERENHEQASGGSFWLLASLGEAALILNEWSEAEDWYAQAAALGASRLGDLNVARRQALVLLEHLGRELDRLDNILRIPRVVVSAGHMIDRPGRARPRFPARLEAAVGKAIRDRIVKVDGRVGFASAACGSDILFLESILELGGEAHVVLPFEKDLFVRESVSIGPDGRWAARFAEVIARATQVILASHQKMQGGSVSYDYANLVLHGLANVRAGELGSELVPLAVWDGRTGDGPGGTATIVERWRGLGLEVEVIDLAEILRVECPDLATPSTHVEIGLEKDPLSDRSPDLRVMAMLFADVVHFSKLTEEQVPKFVKHFLGGVADLMARSTNASVVRNTWGDGLYFVFENVRDAGLFALDLCDMVTTTGWAEKGLPPTLNIRIALHTGPVYRCEDPVTKQLNYTGTHVSRTARIEPITPPGQVYASQAFAAVASVERVKDFHCEYVKLAPLAKGYGTFPTYLVRRQKQVK
jgi:class 3 adenylate cyclase/tetratricopeptide (TPR) repeat protein